MSRGRFIVFEGGEGTGKSTQARLLAEALTRAGLPVVLTREPGGAPGAEALRHLLLEEPPEPPWSPLSEALLHYAARSEHLDKTIKPALLAGRWVISDRFADSTAAYQGAGLALPAEVFERLRALVVSACEPDLTLVLDLDVEEGMRRALARSAAGDRYERMDRSFHERVRASFLALARRSAERYAVIDAAAPAPDVHQAVRHALSERLGIKEIGRDGAARA